MSEWDRPHSTERGVRMLQPTGKDSIGTLVRRMIDAVGYALDNLPLEYRLALIVNAQLGRNSAQIAGIVALPDRAFAKAMGRLLADLERMGFVSDPASVEALIGLSLVEPAPASLVRRIDALVAGSSGAKTMRRQVRWTRTNRLTTRHC